MGARAFRASDGTYLVAEEGHVYTEQTLNGKGHFHVEEHDGKRERPAKVKKTEKKKKDLPKKSAEAPPAKAKKTSKKGDASKKARTENEMASCASAAQSI